MIKKVLKNQKVLLVLFSIFFIGISFLYFSNQFDFSESRYKTKNYKIESNEIKKIKINKNLEYIYLHIDEKELDKNNQIYYHFTIIDNNDKIIYDNYISFKEFIYENEYRVDLKKLNLKEETYKVYVSIDEKSVNFINSFNMDLKYKNTNHLLIFYIIYMLLSLLMIIFLLLFYNKQDKLHVLFFKLALPIFLIYIIAIPMLAGHDELFQWIKSYEISEGKIIPKTKYGYSGSMLPKNIDLGLSPYADNSYQKVFDAFHLKISNENSFSTGLSIDVYSPIQFLPQALGIRVARIFTDRLLLIAYSGRIFNMLACLVLITFAIKIIPTGKKLLMLLCMNPMAIEAFTTLSGDGLTISLSILLIAYILNLKCKKHQIQNKQILILGILSILLSLCKIIYVIIPFFILLIPRKQYKSKKQFIIMLIACLVIPIIVNFIWLILAFSVSEGASAHSIPSKNLNNLLQNPFSIIKYAVYSFEKKGRNLIFEFFGGDLLMCCVLKNTTLVPLLMIMTTIYFVKEKEDKVVTFSKTDIFWIIICSIGLIIALLLSEYVFFCNYNPREIYGFQGRHFMPFMPIVFILLKSLFGKTKHKNSKLILIITCLIINFMTLCELVVTYL